MERVVRRTSILVLSVYVVLSLRALSAVSWPQFGGPSRNFTSGVKGLGTQWPASGPRQLWTRALGEGHSSIVGDGKTLYTMYRPAGLTSFVRRSQEEIVVALNAANGETYWEHRVEARTSGFNFEYGAGPHSTPLIAGHRLFAATSTGRFMALDRRTGKEIWAKELIDRMGGTRLDRGYACSPLAYRESVIMMVGGRGHAVVAFNQSDGRVVWQAQDFSNSPSSPLLINVDGQDQLVVFMADEIAGLDPTNGALLWRHSHATSYGLNISTPVWAEENILFLSSAYNGGSRALKLSQNAGRTTAAELWHTNRMRVHFGSVIGIGNRVYGSSGDFGPAFINAVELETGRVVWQDRSFSRSQLLYADGKLIILDEEGMLGLATIGPQGLNVLARAELLSEKAWTAPALIGTRLYARDRKTILALELGG
jgi:outer membrane protein assembly factor BamB